MVDLVGQYEAIKAEVNAAIQDVLSSGEFIRGRFVERFERNLSDYLGGGYALGVGNGTDALQIAMMAAGIGPGDEVITTPFTFIATAEAAALLGATPVFADIQGDTFNIDPSKVEALITPRTKAIVPVHLFGQPADMDHLMDIAERRGLVVIEDNAQSVGALYKGKRAGLIGHMGTLSFFPSKNLGCYGDGGAVLTNDKKWYERVKLIANHGSRRKYHNEVVGINSRLDALQAAILDVKLAHLDRFNELRSRAALRYDSLLEGTPGIRVPYRAPDRSHVFHQYTLRLGSENTGSALRDAVAAALKQASVPHAIYYPVPLHRLPVFANGQVGVRHGGLDVTEKTADHVLSLPMHTELTDEQIQHIADVVNQTLGRAQVQESEANAA